MAPRRAWTSCWWKPTRLEGKRVPVRGLRTILDFRPESPERTGWQAYTQAQKFGAQMLLTTGTRLACDRKPYELEVEDGTRIPARAIVIATGAEYSKLAIENLSRFEGAGIYYGATFVEAQLSSGEEVIVVGGGNSAGQAAVFLAESTKHVYMLVRGPGLADTMSKYLIRRIEQTPNIS